MYIVITIVVAILALMFVIPNIRIVEQNTVPVIEFLGRFRRIMHAGLNLKIPLEYLVKSSSFSMDRCDWKHFMRTIMGDRITNSNKQSAGQRGSNFLQYPGRQCPGADSARPYTLK